MHCRPVVGENGDSPAWDSHQRDNPYRSTPTKSSLSVLEPCRLQLRLDIEQHCKIGFPDIASRAERLEVRFGCFPTSNPRYSVIKMKLNPRVSRRRATARDASKAVAAHDREAQPKRRITSCTTRDFRPCHWDPLIV